MIALTEYQYGSERLPCQPPIVTNLEKAPFEVDGKRILSARLAYGATHGKALSQAALGRMVGVGQKTVATWEQGRKRPGLDTYLVLARTLGVDPAWLTWGERGEGDQPESRPDARPESRIEMHPLEKEDRRFPDSPRTPLLKPDEGKHRKRG